MDASKIKVSREDMAVIKPEQLGLSLFGVLSSLFQQELSSVSGWRQGLMRLCP